MKKSLFFYFIMAFFFSATAFAAPATLTYQGRILKADGTPLEYENVSFLFQITDPTGSCILYEEQVNGYSMVNSGGVFDTPIGAGSRTYPTGAGVFTVLDSMNNTAALNCRGGASYNPNAADGRLLRVQFYDGVGWKTVSPDNIIRSVPYAGYANSAQKLGNNVATDFVLKAGLPTCGAGTFLSWDGTALSCAPVAGASGGTVTNVSSTNAYLSITNGTSAASLTLNVGTSANTVAAGNDSRLSDARAPTGTAGGDLSGTYPNPSVAKILGRDLDTTAPTSGQFLKFNGASKWAPTSLAISDVTGLSTSLSGMVMQSQFPASCAASQTLTFLSPSGSFTCSTISISGTNFGSQSANLVLASPDSSSGTPTFRALTAGDLPATISSGLWTASGSDVYRTSGNVGIGTAAPASALQIAGTTPVLNVSGSTSAGIMLQGSGSGAASSATIVNSGTAANSNSALIVAENQSSPYLAVSLNYYNASFTAAGNTQPNSGVLMSWAGASGGLRMGSAGTTAPVAIFAGGQNKTPAIYVLPGNPGYVGIGTTTPGVALDVNGTVRATAFSGPLTSTTTSVGTGTAGAPSMTFSGDTNTGFYDASSNDTIGVVAGGSNIFNFTTTGLASATTGGANITTGAGTVGAPTFSFAGDAGTGWWRPAANTMAASTGGAERMRIDSAGNVGIGTTTASYPLDVYGQARFNVAGTGGAITASTPAGESGFQITNTNRADIRFDNSTLKLVAGTGTSFPAATNGIAITTTGNVGVGITAPAASMQIYKVTPTGTITSSSTAITGVGTNFTTAFSVGDQIVASGQVKSITAIGSATAMTIGSAFTSDITVGAAYNRVGAVLTAGNVGIGTTAPLVALDVTSSTSGTGAIKVQSTSTNGYSSMDMYDSSGVNQGSVGWGNSAATAVLRNLLYFGTTSSSPVVIRTAGNERMRFDSAGNVGIGTSGPTANLQVLGSPTNGTTPVFNITNTAASTYVPSFTALAPNLTAGQQNYFALGQSATNGNWASFGFTYAGNNSASNRLDLNFYGSTPYISVLNGGNVGIGTTSPGVALDVYGTVRATAFSGPLTSTTTSVGTGTAGAPSMTFSGDTNTGFYDASSNDTIGVVTGGSNIFNFTANGLASPTTGAANITTAAGTVGAPTFSFAGDTGTGWWRPAANTMAASTGGSERMRIDSSGNVGIGSTGPGTKLDIYDSSASADVLRLSSEGSYSSFQARSANNVDWSGGYFTTYRSRGTMTSPSVVQANDTILGIQANAYDGSVFQNAGGIAVEAGATATSGVAPGQITFYTNSLSGIYGPKMKITANGNVGIGSTGPDSTLVVRSAQPSTTTHPSRAGIIAEGQGTDVGGRFAARVYSDTETPSLLGYRARGNFSAPTAAQVGDSLLSISGIARDSSGWPASGSSSASINMNATENQTPTAKGGLIAFFTVPNGTTTSTERVRIDQNGNVGIGTAGPSALLSLGQSLGNKFLLYDDGTGNNRVGFGVAANENRMFVNTGGALTFGHVSTADATTYSEKMRISAAGSVGIGTVSPNATLDVGSAALSTAEPIEIRADNASGRSALRIGQDATHNGYLTWFYNATAANAYMGIGTFTGNNTLALNPDGGKVGIGTVTPPSLLANSATNTLDTNSIGVNLAYGLTWVVPSSGTVGYAATFTNLRTTANSNGVLISSNDTSTASRLLEIEGSGASKFLVRADGYVGIGTATPAAPLHVYTANTSGNIASFLSGSGGCSIAFNGTSCSSDARLKENVETSDGTAMLNNLLQLRSVHFTWIKDPNHEKQTGFIAQELQKLFPEFIKTDSNGYLQVNYASFVSVLTAAIQQMHSKFTQEFSDVHRDIASLKAAHEQEVSELKARLQKQETDFNARLKQQDADFKARTEKQERELQAIKQKLGL